MGLWEKAQKNAWNSLHSITIGSSTLSKRAIFKLLNDGALGVENDIARKNYVSSSFKDSCPGIKTLNHIESKPVKVLAWWKRRSTEYGGRSAEYGVWSTEYGVRSTEYGVGSAECGCGVRSAESVSVKVFL